MKDICAKTIYSASTKKKKQHTTLPLAASATVQLQRKHWGLYWLLFLLSPQQTRAFEVVKWLRLACKGEQIDFINRKNGLSFKWADLFFLGGANLVQAAFSKLLPVYLLPFISREGFSIVCASVAPSEQFSSPSLLHTVMRCVPAHKQQKRVRKMVCARLHSGRNHSKQVQNCLRVRFLCVPLVIIHLING